MVAGMRENEEKVMQVEVERIRKHIARLIGKKGGELAEAEFHVTKGSNHGDNYASSIYRVIVKDSQNGGQSDLSFIVKCPPIDEKRRKTLHFQRIFSHELTFYREILPAFTAFLRQHNTTLTFLPTFYAGRHQEFGDSILVLEDLRTSGYRMHLSKMLDYHHLALSLRFLARFHAYSFALRAKKPKIFEAFKRIDEPAYPPEDNKAALISYSRRYPSLCNIIAKALLEENRHYRQRFARFAETFQESMMSAVSGSNAEPYAVVNHGDAWTNNILFKYSKDGVPIDLKFIDFQLHRYASPVLDIVYLIFCCSSYDTRQKVYDRLLEDYYQAFSTSLKNFGCEPCILFPRDVFSQHLSRFGKFAAGMAVFTVHVFTEEPGKSTEIESKLDAKQLEKRLCDDPAYKRTIIETFKDLIDRDYI